MLRKGALLAPAAQAVTAQTPGAEASTLHVLVLGSHFSDYFFPSCAAAIMQILVPGVKQFLKVVITPLQQSRSSNTYLDNYHGSVIGES